MAKQILKRSEVNEKDTWNLKDIFESDEKWMEEYEALKSVPEQISAFEGKISKSAKDLLAFFKMSDDIEVRLSKFHGYASQKSDEDTGNNKYQDFVGKASATYVAIGRASSFSNPEIMSISEETMNEFYKQEPGLLTYKRNIDKLRARAKHILSGPEESIIAASHEATGAAEDIGSVMRNADMKWADVVDKDGNKHPLTNGSFVPLLESPDRDLREKTFKTYYEHVGEFKNTFAAILNGQFKQLNYSRKVRKYESTLEASLDRTEVPVKVYTNLIDAVHGNLDKMYKYVSLRKKMLGVDELHMYDVYTPIVADAANEISFEEAKETVLKALAVLGEDYTDLLKEGFNNRWIDVYENEGKRSGAYSSGNSFPHPFVLLNHKDNLDSMFTLAHEMGHALHSYHSTKYQPVNTCDYVIFVAEVASTCNEVLLMKYLLNNTTDKKEKAYLINHFLDSFKGTIYRQTMFAEFELMMGKMVENGEALTADALCEKYLELNKLYFGPDMVSDDEIKYEWARIPHFFYNYYVFQYATGYSAAVAIANRILKEGEPAVRDYKEFLKGGSSKDPISLLKIAGVDMESPEPINQALSLFGELIDELNALN